MRHVRVTKDRDRAVVEAVVRDFGPLSRADIRHLTHLRWSTISPLVRELINQGKLLEVGRANNLRGRKQILLRLNEEYGYIVGIMFDPETVSVAAMDLSPRIRSIVTEVSCLDRGVEGLVHQLFDCVEKAIHQGGVGREKLLGVSIADPGLVNVQEGISILCVNINFWKDVPLKRLLEQRFEVPCTLESATRLQALAERRMGAGGGAEDMIYVEYGKGIGAGVIIGGKVLLGHDWAAGEFGHIPIIENGPPCNCGSFGCLEAIVGLSAIEARCRKAIQGGGSSKALEIANGEVGQITGWSVLQAASLGDKMCAAIVEDLGKYLGLGISTLVNLFNPSLIVLDHRLALAGESLLEQIGRAVKRQALGRSTANLGLCYGKLGNEVGVLGSALNFLEKMFEIPALKPPRFMVEKSTIDELSSKRLSNAMTLDA
jgi:predicted NBD/HSP70 family sugar kinase